MSPSPKEFPNQYFMASALAATVNYPLWRSAAIGQSGFAVGAQQVGSVTVPRFLSAYVYGFMPPYKGVVATVWGMTWARAAIFYGSDAGRQAMLQAGYAPGAATVVPPLLLSTVVQVVNQPIVRSTVTLQNPSPTDELAQHHRNVWDSMKHLYRTKGVAGLWHGTTAGVLKTVPKYVTAIAVKDFMEEWLPKVEDKQGNQSAVVTRSAVKSLAAGVAGAALTNPLDVIRNEQFKTHEGLRTTVRQLWNTEGWRFAGRGLGKNMIAVAMPVGMTIFFTDLFIQWTNSN